MKDKVLKSLICNDSVRLYVCSSTNLVNDLQKKQHLWPTTLAALGRTLTVTAMMSTMLKGKETITININGNGPAGQILTGGNANGEIKGYIENKEVHFEYHELKKLNVKMAIGTDGFLTVTKDLGMGKIYTSQVELQTGEIGDDFTYYFTKSEQIPTAVGVGVLVDTDNFALSSGGFILQVLPNCSEEVISFLEEKIKCIKSVSDLFNNCENLEDIIRYFSSDYKILEEKKICYKCDCSKEKFLNGLKKLDKQELKTILDEDKKIETVCHFCHEKYIFTEDDFKDYF